MEPHIGVFRGMKKTRNHRITCADMERPFVSRWSGILLCLMLVSPIPLIDGDVEAACDSSANHNLPSSLIPHGPILIDSDAELESTALDEGWPGTGGAEDPYVIQNLFINATGGQTAIYLGNITRHVSIRDCELTGAIVGIWLRNDTYTQIDGVDVWGVTEKGMYSTASSVKVSNCSIRGSDYGIEVSMSTIDILNSTFLDNRFSLYLLNSRTYTVHVIGNTMICSGGPNYGTCGIYASQWSSARIEKNRIQGFTNGIAVVSVTSNVSVVGNQVTDCTYGLDLDASYDAMITDNRFDAWKAGITLSGSKGVTILRNSFDKLGIDFGDDAMDVMLTHTIDSSNTVNGVPIEYHANQDLVQPSTAPGQLIAINCQRVEFSGHAISTAFAGVFAAYCGQVNLTDNTVAANGPCVIRLYYSKANITGNNISNCRFLINRCSIDQISDNELDNGSLYLYRVSNGVRIVDNWIHAIGTSGLELSISQNSIIRNNHIKVSSPYKGWQELGFSYAMILSSDKYISVEGNSMEGAGIKLDGVSNDWPSIEMDRFNTVDGRPVVFLKNSTNVRVDSPCGQILLINCPGFNITDQDMVGGASNIFVARTNGGTIHRNRIRNTYDNPIVLVGCRNVRLIKNVLSDGAGWMEATLSTDISFLGNYFMNISTWDAIRIWQCTNTTIAQNYFGKMTYSAVFIYYMASKGLITGNHFEGSNDEAVRVSAPYFVVHHNYLNDNNLASIGTDALASQAVSGWNVTWDDGKEGNYWSDYASRYPTATNDGTTWDTPYEISDTSKIVARDGHPLVQFKDVVPPIAFARRNASIAQGESLELDGSCSIDNIGIVNYSWTIGQDGSAPLYGMRASKRFDVRGVIQVTLRVVDAAGNRDEVSFWVTVRDVTAPVARAGEDVTISQDESVTLNATASTDNSGIDSYLWSFEYDGDTVHSNRSVSVLWFSIPGIYVVKLRVTDVDGNWGEDEMVVTVLDTEPPIPEAGPDIDIDQHETVLFNASLSTDNGAIVRWRWTMVYDASPMEFEVMTFSFTFHLAGEFLLTLIVTDAAGNWGTAVKNVRVRDIEPPVADAGDDIVVGQGHYAKFNGSRTRDNAGIYGMRWTFIYKDREVELVGEYPDFLFEEFGNYTVLLSVMDTSGNGANDTVVVSVEDLTPPEIAALLAHEVDQHSVVSFNAEQSRDNVGIVNWTWTIDYNGTSIVLGGPKVTFRFDNAGEYNVTLVVRDAHGNANSTGILVRVRDIEPPVAVVAGDIHVKAGDPAQFDGSGSTDNVGVTTWYWYCAYGSKDVQLNGRTTSYVFEKGGEYHATLTVWDDAGLKDTVTFTVFVEEATAHTDGGMPVLLIVLVVVIVLLAAVGLILVLRRRRRPST